nr:uncharacterized protein CI109_000651 [Kwoniella shandongensis]KAA5531079.1 hypothetical protein CI109_000651 [Kwoniella shandongensis]
MALRHATSFFPYASASSSVTQFARPSFPCPCPRRLPRNNVSRLLRDPRLSYRLASTSSAVERQEEGERQWSPEPLPVPDNVPSSSISRSSQSGSQHSSAPNPTTSSTSSPPDSLPSSPSSGHFGIPNNPNSESSTASTGSSSGNASSRFALNSPIVTAITTKCITPEVRARLAEWSGTVMQHSRQVAQGAEKRLVDLGLKVNQMTGYQEVERLKALVFHKEDELQRLRETARATKAAYDEAVAARSAAQRDVNSLLERKHSWTDADVSRFTSLVRADHSSTHAVASTSVQLKESELAVDKAFSELMQTILQRYHEEQVWSDKIRSVSTWANLIGLALNLIIFVGAVAVVEPWKRRRLVERLEERMAGMMEKVDRRLGGVEGHLASVAAAGASHETYLRGSEVEQITGRSSPTASQEAFLADDVAVPSPELLLAPLSEPSTSPSSSLSSRPLLTKAITGLPAYLDVVAQPSQERDLAAAGLIGAALATAIMTLGRIMLSG